MTWEEQLAETFWNSSPGHGVRTHADVDGSRLATVADLKAFIRTQKSLSFEEGREAGFHIGHVDGVQETLDAVRAGLPLFNRWNDTLSEGYKNNSAVEHPETGRNSVLREVRALLDQLKANLTKEHGN